MLWLLLAAYVLSFIDRNILALMVDPIRRDLQISDFEMSLLQGSAFALLYSFMSLPIAHLADSRRRTGIIAIGIAVWSAMTALSGVARSFAALFALRLGVGLGEAALSPPATSLLSDYFERDRFPRAMAVFNLGISFGTGLSFLVGGFVVAAVSGISDVSLPIVGDVRPWQLTFFIIGLPGLLLAAVVATLREPKRRGAILDAGGAVETIPLAQVARFILRRWRIYICFPVSTSFLSIFGFGMSAWYPTFLMRVHGLSVGEAGTVFGLSYVIFGTAGTLFGVRMAERLQMRGHRDGHLRFILIVALLMTAFGIVGPLMPNAPLAVLFLVPAVFLKNSYLGSSGSALHLVTPNQLRAKITALQIFFSNIIGMTVGASGIAFLTDFVFVDDEAVRYSLSVTAAIVCPLGALVVKTCLRPYVAAVEETRQRERGEAAGD